MSDSAKKLLLLKVMTEAAMAGVHPREWVLTRPFYSEPLFIGDRRQTVILGSPRRRVGD